MSGISLSSICGRGKQEYQRPSLPAKDEEIIAPIPSLDSPVGLFGKETFERALDELAPKLTSYASRLAVTRLIAPIIPSRIDEMGDEVAGEVNLAIDEHDTFFATYYPTHTYWNWARNLLARLLHALTSRIIGWRIDVGMEIVREAVGQKAKDGMVALLRDVTCSLHSYVGEYNDACKKWAEEKKAGDTTKGLSEYARDFRGKQIGLKKLCGEAEDLALRIAFPWGLRTIPQWLVRQHSPLYSAITSLHEDVVQVGEGDKEGVVHKIHRSLVPVLKQAYESLGLPTTKVDLSRRELLLQFNLDAEKKLPSHIQALAPAVRTMLRTEHARSNKKPKELCDAILAYHDPEKHSKETWAWADNLLNIEEYLEDEGTRNFVTEMIFGTLAGVDLYHYMTLLINNVAFAFEPHDIPNKDDARVQFETLLRVVCDTVFDRYWKHKGGVSYPPKVTAEIDAAADDISRLAATQKQIEETLLFAQPQVRERIDHLLATLPIKARGSLEAMQKGFKTDKLFDLFGSGFYQKACKAADQLPKELLHATPPIARTLKTMVNRVARAADFEKASSLIARAEALAHNDDKVAAQAKARGLLPKIERLRNELENLSKAIDLGGTERYVLTEEDDQLWINELSQVTEYVYVCLAELRRLLDEDQEWAPFQLDPAYHNLALTPTPDEELVWVLDAVQDIADGDRTDMSTAITHQQQFLSCLVAYRRDHDGNFEDFEKDLASVTRQMLEDKDVIIPEDFPPENFVDIEAMLQDYREEQNTRIATTYSHVERLLIRFNEFEIKRLADECKELLDGGLDVGLLQSAAELRAKVGRVEERSSPLGRATHAVEWLQKSNVAAFHKRLMTESVQEIFSGNLRHIEAAHEKLKRLLARMDRSDKLYTDQLQRQELGKKCIRLVSGKDPNWYEVANHIESLDRRIAAAKKTLTTYSPAIADLLFYKELRHLLAAAHYSHQLKRLSEGETNARNLDITEIQQCAQSITQKRKTLANLREAQALFPTLKKDELISKEKLQQLLDQPQLNGELVEIANLNDSLWRYLSSTSLESEVKRKIGELSDALENENRVLTGLIQSLQSTLDDKSDVVGDRLVEVQKAAEITGIGHLGAQNQEGIPSILSTVEKKWLDARIDETKALQAHKKQFLAIRSKLLAKIAEAIRSGRPLQLIAKSTDVKRFAELEKRLARTGKDAGLPQPLFTQLDWGSRYTTLLAPARKLSAKLDDRDQQPDGLAIDERSTIKTKLESLTAALHDQESDLDGVLTGLEAALQSMKERDAVNTDEIEQLLGEHSDALLQAHQDYLHQLSQKVEEELIELKSTASSADWRGEGIWIPSIYNPSNLWNHGGKAFSAWRYIEDIKQVYLVDMCDGFARFLQTPSHQEQLAGIVLQLAVGVLKQVHA